MENYLIEIIIVIFSYIFWKEGKHDGIIINQFFELLRLRRKANERIQIPYDIQESKIWHKIDFINWVLIGICLSSVIVILTSDIKYFLLLLILAALRIVIFNPTVNSIIGQGFFYIGNTGWYDKKVRKLGKWHWFIWLAILITSYIIIK